MVIYDSADIYIEKGVTLIDKITRLDAVISALLTVMVKAAVNENITEYDLDNGQTKIKTVYRGVAAIQRSINGLETMKQMYINQLNGRSMRLIDSKNLRRNNNVR